MYRLFLATASVHNLVLVTRNERDGRDRAVPVLNPGSQPGEAGA